VLPGARVPSRRGAAADGAALDGSALGGTALDGTDTDAAADAFIARAAITHHHPVGTLRMGRSDDAPVTPDLRFRGLDGLRVVDASVIPAITAGPVHAAVLAIAESFASTYSS